MTTEANLNDPKLRANAVKAARGFRPFDLLIENTVVLDMVTGRERPADIGVVGALIASVHPHDPSREATQRIDAGGAHAVPGLIDTHMHIESSMITPAEYANAVVPRGVTQWFGTHMNTQMRVELQGWNTLCKPSEICHYVF